MSAKSFDCKQLDKYLNKKFLFLLQFDKIKDILFNNILTNEEKVKKIVEFAVSLGFTAAGGWAGAMIPGFPLIGRSVGQYVASCIFDYYAKGV